jgi:hypothetical protein
MRTDKRIKLEELRQPGMRRILEAMRAIEDEAPGLLEEATLASSELAKNRGDGGRLPQ